MDIVRFDLLIRAAGLAIACVLAITLLSGCKFDVSMGATNEPLDSNLLGEWQDPDPNRSGKASSLIKISEIPGQKRFKIVWDTKEFEGYRVDLPVPDILELRKVKPAEEGYYLFWYTIRDDQIKIKAIFPPPDQNVSADELKKYVLRVVESKEQGRLIGLFNLRKLKEPTWHEEMRVRDEEAVERTRKLKEQADAGDVHAMLEVAHSYAFLAKSGLEDGQPLDRVDRFMEGARRYFFLAAKSGSAEGAYHLGLCFEMGFGGKKDLNLAYKTYEIAAKKGWKGASEKLQQLRAAEVQPAP